MLLINFRFLYLDEIHYTLSIFLTTSKERKVLGEMSIYAGGIFHLGGKSWSDPRAPKMSRPVQIYYFFLLNRVESTDGSAFLSCVSFLNLFAFFPFVGRKFDLFKRLKSSELYCFDVQIKS